ncbi:uncharacterized protein LOC131437138 [Malaya genurostris]|uniref:uncharacterized protein LOC131437138 n=1 Tax=Malaya genurostris TaxID=325434 RepID=UPI0026F3FA69|nr:uncharacterized protein LOC131437138 [Malaya genurostris]
MEKYVTVVSVDNQPSTQGAEAEDGGSSQLPNVDIKEVPTGGVPPSVDSSATIDSQFVTVLSINHGKAVEGTEPEMVLVYRLPGERLGFGLKFQGGTKNNEKIQRLFIQSCAENSPASRVQASWGYLREGDEILEIDGVSVTRMTRIECVKCLKESNLAIKLLVRNGEGKVLNFFDENGDLPERKSIPPPPPPVPPRKLNKRKVTEQQNIDPPTKQNVEIIHPPDAEVYSNLFSDDISDLISESDDTASTISTVIDKYSICSSLSSEDYTISSNPSSLELAKALKPFTLLEKEFNLDSKLENNLFTFQPQTSINVVQLEVRLESSSNEYENITIAKLDENKNYENVVIHASDHQPQNYENVTIQTVTDPQPYENVIVSTSSDTTDPIVYENVDLKAPPQPLPRQTGQVSLGAVDVRKRSAPLASVIPPPRQKSQKIAQLPSMPPHLPHEFNTIQSWLQEATEVIHECALTPTGTNSGEPVKEDKQSLRNANSNENLPRLIDFHPKVPSSFKSVSFPQPTIVTIETTKPSVPNNQEVPTTPEDQSVRVKKCIKIVANGVGEMVNYLESSSDEEEEKIYEPSQMEQDRLLCGNDDSGSYENYSDEDGEKLGPPEIVDGGPSEAYFNFHWSTTLLPPIGEVEEEFSSLENQQSGPIVIIDTAEETLFNDSNNNQHRELKLKLDAHFWVDEEPISPSESDGVDYIPAMIETELVSPTPHRRQSGNSPPVPSRTVSIPSAEGLACNSKQCDVIETGENETAVEMRSNPGTATIISTDKNGDASKVPTVATTSSELNKTETNVSAGDAEKRLDQLMNDLVDDNDSLSASAPEVHVVMEMDPVTEIPKSSIPLLEVEQRHTPGKPIEAQLKVEEKPSVSDVSDEDMDLLAVVGDNVDSDFDELVKSQLDDVNSEQIQLIHERIIVGIERSSTSGDGSNSDRENSADQKIEEPNVSDSVTDSNEQAIPEDVPDGKVTSDAAFSNELKVENNQESANSSQQTLTPAGVPGSNTAPIGADDNVDELSAATSSSQTVTIMDQMNNVVTTTTTATAIASTVHQQTTATPTIATTIGYHKIAAAPPAFSRLPPDGHEFPPNFSEPSVATMTAINGGSNGAPIGAKGDKHSSYEDIPDLPKSHPPAVPRKVYRQDLVLKPLDQNQSTETVYKKPPVFPSSPARSNSLVADISNSPGKATHAEGTRRRSFDIHEINKPPARVTLVGSNWRKDEKSERSVRDKIAMFSNGSSAGGGGAGSENEGSTVLRKFSKDFTKSSENLLSVGDGGHPRKGVDPIEAYATLRKKAHSVENLDEVDSIPNDSEFKPLDNGGYKTKFSLETSKPVMLGKAFSVENLNPSNVVKAMSDDSKYDGGGLFGNAKILSRTTSFSGYSNGSSLASINHNVEERRKSSITNLLEQRKKSMSKLRGLVIPEKVPETEVLPDSKIIGLPIIKSKDSEKILSSHVLSRTPESTYTRKSTTLSAPSKSNGNQFTPMVTPKPSVDIGGSYKSIFRNLNGSSLKPEPRIELDEEVFRKPIALIPPAKPPRTSLVYPAPKGLDQRSQTTEDESDDSDSVLSSRVSSPPVSPVAPSPPEKYVLTRTLSSETNTSIASSNSTLTSSSGSQASCSSVGSTPAIDMSRRISKSSSSEMSMNRKNVLASAKCRSGRGDLKIEEAANGKTKRYEDGDSTDGYEEEERRKSKSKPRGSINNGKNSSNGFEEQELTHYKVVDTADSIVDKVIKVASYVEVVSDVEENASVETEVVIPMQKPIESIKEKISFNAAKSTSVDSGAANAMSDLAKWVRHEAAKTIVNKESELPARNETKKYVRPVSEQPPKPSEDIKPSPVKRELRSSVDTKKLNLAEIRKSFEAKSNGSTVVPSPIKIASKELSTPVGKTVANQHDRFSSWDSLASSSSGVSSLQANSMLGNAVANCTGSSQTLQSTPSDYGSFSSLGSSHSLITPQDLQLIIEEADPPLAAPEAFVIVLQRETPESSIGITLAGGSDYEAKEITIHKILNNSPAEKDGRLKRGDRILSINGLSMRGLTHRESLSVLKTPRPEVVMVITRSKSLVIDNSILGKTKRPSLGSLSSLAEKNEISDYERKIKIQHKASRSLDLDLDIVSNEAESVFDGTASEDGLLSADESKCSSITPASDEITASNIDNRVVEIVKDGAGLGFSIEGGYDSPAGNKPLLIKKIFMGGAAEKSGLLKAGEEIVAINDFSIERMTRIQVWNMMKKLPNGGVRITLK